MVSRTEIEKLGLLRHIGQRRFVFPAACVFRSNRCIKRKKAAQQKQCALWFWLMANGQASILDCSIRFSRWSMADGTMHDAQFSVFCSKCAVIHNSDHRLLRAALGTPHEEGRGEFEAIKKGIVEGSTP